MDSARNLPAGVTKQRFKKILCLIFFWPIGLLLGKRLWALIAAIP